jgi:hypothetical protein
MGQFFRVNGDYNIKVKDGYKITLDVGEPDDGGSVIITGNLDVRGSTTSIGTTDLEVEDNIIVLNIGGGATDGSGILPALRYSGIEIDRGITEDSSITPRPSIVFDEQDNSAQNIETDEEPGSWIFAYRSSSGVYGFENSNIKVRRIFTNSSTDGGDLTLVGSSSLTGVVKVSGTTDYTNEILTRAAALDPEVTDILTNKGYVDYSILNNPTFQIRAPGIGAGGDTRVIIADKDIASGASSPAYLFSETGLNSGPLNDETSVTFVLDGQKSAQIFKDRLELPGLIIFDESYTNTGNLNPDDPITGVKGYDYYLARQQDAIVFQTQNTNGNIKLEPNGTGRVQMTWAVQYDHANGVYPGYVNNSTLIYADGESTGKTGLYFVTANDTRGEFISKNRALLFSMLF